jgi:hypothetical protein
MCLYTEVKNTSKIFLIREFPFDRMNVIFEELFSLKPYGVDAVLFLTFPFFLNAIIFVIFI